jgi:glycosyltransferase involved in cell wall biosynthesis
VIVMTDAIARELHRIYGVDCRIVRPGVDTTIPRSKKTRHDGAFRLISISRLESTKRLDWVLRALAALESSPRPLSQLRDWRFDIVGDGSQRAELESLSTSLGLSSRVSFHGWLDDRAVQTVNNEADLFVMPAAQGYGLPALESLVRRIPVIIHRDSGVSEIFDRNPWVRIVSAPDGTDLGSAIREMSEAISRGEISDYPVPMIPSETDWAAEISRICGWIETG